jgi:hypothetical protein
MAGVHKDQAAGIGDLPGEAVVGREAARPPVLAVGVVALAGRGGSAAGAERVGAK